MFVETNLTKSTAEQLFGYEQVAKRIANIRLTEYKWRKPL